MHNPLLEGLRVLDLSRLLPGPYCSSILADLGAKVVKIEDPRGGDYLRWMPPVAGDQSAYFHALNRGKQSVAIDLKQKEAQGVFVRLLQAGYDIVLESFRPGVMDRLGLGYEILKGISPGVILCSVSGHGQSGPRSPRAGHDLNYMALSGLLGSIGYSRKAPVIPGAQIADVGGGSLMAAIGILAAVHRRSRTGEGAWIDISMTEGAMTFSAMHLGAREAMEEPLERGRGLLSGERPGYSLYRTSDGGYMSLAALEPVFWKAFCRVIGREDLENSGLSTGEEGERVRNEISAVFARRTQPEWEDFFSGQDVCCEPVREGDAVFEDPQFIEREVFVRVDDPVAGSLRQLSCPIKLRGETAKAPRPAPRLGADTDSVLGSAGFSELEVQALRERNVVS